MTPGHLKAALAALPRMAAAALAPALEAAAGLAAIEAQRLLAGSGPGPSDPGQVPADPSGELARSIVAMPTPEGAVVTVRSPQALPLEYGTATMAARPFLRPAIHATRAEAQSALAEAYARFVAGALGGRP